MKKIIKSLLLLLFIAGCAGSPVQTGWEAEKNRSVLLQLNIGTTKSEVLKLMGEPRKTEAYGGKDRSIEFWLYMTEGVTIDDRRLKDSNFTPLAFENGKLIGWGRNFYENTLKIEHSIDVK